MWGISIIIPVLNESDRISALLTRLHRLDTDCDREVIVVDGSPECDTIRVVTDPRIRCIAGPLGRARQMNAGAKIARGRILLFLHADTRLPDGGLVLIEKALSENKVEAGAFDLGIDSPRKIHKLFGRIASIRSRLTRIPYGDQAIFISKSLFSRIGGFRDIPIMEDVEIMQRIRKCGLKISIIPRPVMTSPRRWEQEGLIRCTLRNWVMLSAYLWGVSPARLVRFYPPSPQPHGPSGIDQYSRRGI